MRMIGLDEFIEWTGPGTYYQVPNGPRIIWVREDRARARRYRTIGTGWTLNECPPGGTEEVVGVCRWFRQDGCTCRPIPTNGGVEADTYGCPIHCTHPGLASGRRAVCACGWEGVL